MDTEKRKYIPEVAKPRHDNLSKGVMFKFRVNEVEKRLLDAVMKPYQWRNFCVLLAMAHLNLKEGVDMEGRLVTLRDINLHQLLEDVQNNVLGRKDEGEQESQETEEPDT